MMRNKSAAKVRFYVVILMLRDTRGEPYKSEIYCVTREMRILFAAAAVVAAAMVQKRKKRKETRTNL